MNGTTLFVFMLLLPILAFMLTKAVQLIAEDIARRKQLNEVAPREIVSLKHKHFKGVPRKSVVGTRNQSQADADFYDAFIWWCKINNVSSSTFEGWVEEALVYDSGYFSLKYEWYVYRRTVQHSGYFSLIRKALGGDFKLLDDFDQSEGSIFYKAIPKFLENMEKQISAINFQFGDNLEYVEKYSKNINYELLTKPFVVDTMSLHKLDTPLN